MSGALKSNWYEKAHCKGKATQEFYPEFTTTPIPPHIQRLCDTCPVQGECLTRALVHRESGIWGGTTEAQRNAILSKNLRKVCLRCRSDQIFASKRFMVCLACGVSWRIK